MKNTYQPDQTGYAPITISRGERGGVKIGFESGNSMVLHTSRETHRVPHANPNRFVSHALMDLDCVSMTYHPRRPNRCTVIFPRPEPRAYPTTMTSTRDYVPIQIQPVGSSSGGCCILLHPHIACTSP